MGRGRGETNDGTSLRGAFKNFHTTVSCGAEAISTTYRFQTVLFMVSDSGWRLLQRL